MECVENPQLKFSRVEYKYLISSALADELKEYFSKYTVLDEANSEGKPYIIRSLYFDSPSLTFCQEKMNGDNERTKVRIRAYSDKTEEKVFLEMKKKFGDRTHKERMPIAHEDYAKLMRGDTEFLLNSDNFFFKKIWYLSNFYRLTPKVLNRYERTSFIDKFANFKISFDENLTNSSPESLYKETSLLEPTINGVIMEVKFGSLLPNYFMDMIKKYGLRQHPNSKYVLSIQKAYPKHAPHMQSHYN